MEILTEATSVQSRAWRKAAYTLGGIMFQKVEKQEVDSWGLGGEVLTQSHGLITKSGHCCPTGLPASNTRHHPVKVRGRTHLPPSSPVCPWNPRWRSWPPGAPAPSSAKRDVCMGGGALTVRIIASSQTSICPERLVYRVLGSKPAIQWLAIRRQRDPTMTKDLTVPRKALSCVGY